MALVAGCCQLSLETCDRCRRGDAIQRHIDQRGHTAGSRRPSRRGETFPIGTAGLVNVDVRVNEPGHQHCFVADFDEPATFRIIIEGCDGADAAIIDVYARWSDRLWGDDAGRAYGEV